MDFPRAARCGSDDRPTAAAARAGDMPAPPYRVLAAFTARPGDADLLREARELSLRLAGLAARQGDPGDSNISLLFRAELSCETSGGQASSHRAEPYGAAASARALGAEAPYANRRSRLEPEAEDGVLPHVVGRW
jgi:hypothetical protein